MLDAQVPVATQKEQQDKTIQDWWLMIWQDHACEIPYDMPPRNISRTLPMCCNLLMLALQFQLAF